jgi:hypothetical protein
MKNTINDLFITSAIIAWCLNLAFFFVWLIDLAMTGSIGGIIKAPAYAPFVACIVLSLFVLATGNVVILIGRKLGFVKKEAG